MAQTISITCWRDVQSVDAWGNPSIVPQGISFLIRVEDWQPYRAGETAEMTDDGFYKHRLKRMFIFEDHDIKIGDRVVHPEGNYVVVEIAEYTGHHREVICRGEGE